MKTWVSRSGSVTRRTPSAAAFPEHLESVLLCPGRGQRRGDDRVESGLARVERHLTALEHAEIEQIVEQPG